jgi:hypothetical protein
MPKDKSVGESGSSAAHQLTSFDVDVSPLERGNGGVLQKLFKRVRAGLVGGPHADDKLAPWDRLSGHSLRQADEHSLQVDRSDDVHGPLNRQGGTLGASKIADHHDPVEPFVAGSNADRDSSPWNASHRNHKLKAFGRSSPEDFESESETSNEDATSFEAAAGSHSSAEPQNRSKENDNGHMVKSMSKSKVDYSDVNQRSISGVDKKSLQKLVRRFRISNPDDTLKEYWMRDEISKECYECKLPFTTFRRRHHCRVCGTLSLQWLLYASEI